MKKFILALALFCLVSIIGYSSDAAYVSFCCSRSAAPVVTASSFVISSPVTNGGSVGTAACSANCGGLTWSITAGNAAGNFAINGSTGAITTTASGVTNLTNALDTFALTVQASNGLTGSNAVSVNAYADGSVNAPAGTAQYPSVLSGYSFRPPWKVAGFDYYVGIPTGTTLSLPASISNPNINIVGQLVRCDGAGASVTLTQIDFTGYSIYIPSGGCASLTVTKSNFACSVSNTPFSFINTQNDTAMDIQQNKFDTTTNCNAWPSNVSDILGCGGATAPCTLQYNQIYHMSERFLSAPCGSVLYQFNLIDNPNTVAGAHENFMQQGCANGSTQTGPTVQFNGAYNALSTNGAEGWQYTGCCSQVYTMVNPAFRYNTAIALQVGGVNTMSFIVHGFCHSTADCGSTSVAISGTGAFTSNYFDVSGASGAFYPGVGTNMWPAQAVFTNNINMNTGATLTP